MDRAQSLLQSADTIPENVLLRIITYACFEQGSPQLRRAMRISHVCKYWRRVALSEQKLWADVYFTHKNVKLPELALSRMDPDTPFSFGLIEVGTPEVNPEGYNFLKDKWHRVEALSICPLNSDDDFPRILQFIVENPPTTYTLKDLHMYADRFCETDFEDETPPPPPADCRPIAEHFARIEVLRSVEYLNLYAVTIPAWSPLYDNLVDLDLSMLLTLIPVHQMLDAFHRSPRLQSIVLVHALEKTVPDVSVEVPVIQLSELRQLRMEYNSVNSTAFLMDHIHAPNLKNLANKAKGDGSGAEFARLLRSLRNTSLAHHVTKVSLITALDDEISLRSNHYDEDDYSWPLELCLDNATWEGQCRSPSFLQLLPNLRKIHLHADSSKLANMLRDHRIEELSVSGPMDTNVFYEMGPGGSLTGVHTLQLDCWRFASVYEEGLQILSRAKSLRLLRLDDYGHQSDKLVQEVVQFGVQNQVWIQWLNQNSTLSEESCPKTPSRVELPVLASRARYHSEEMEEEVKKLAGRKRTLDEAEEEPPIPKAAPMPTKMHFRVDRRYGWERTDPLMYAGYDEWLSHRWPKEESHLRSWYGEGLENEEDNYAEEDGMDLDHI